MSSKTDSGIGKKLDKIGKRLDMIIIILLARSGLSQKEIADIIGISERTIRNMLPFRQIKQTLKEE